MRTYFVDVYKMAKDLVLHFLQDGGLIGWGTSGMLWVVEGIAFGGGSPSRHLAWVKSLVAPLKSLNVTFRAYVDEVRYKMYITGQVVYLEHYLNDLYDPVVRRIYISDGDAGVPLFLYRKADNQPITVYNKSEGETPPFMLNKGDFEGQVDFIVNLPYEEVPATALNKMRAQINRYKQAGKRYKFTSQVGGPPYPFTE